MKRLVDLAFILEAIVITIWFLAFVLAPRAT